MVLRMAARKPSKLTDEELSSMTSATDEVGRTPAFGLRQIDGGWSDSARAHDSSPTQDSNSRRHQSRDHSQF